MSAKPRHKKNKKLKKTKIRAFSLVSKKIIFLNKKDIFIEKLKEYPLSNVFSDYNERKDDNYAIKFICDKFCTKRNDIHAFLTTLIDCQKTQNCIEECILTWMSYQNKFISQFCVF